MRDSGSPCPWRTPSSADGAGVLSQFQAATRAEREHVPYPCTLSRTTLHLLSLREPSPTGAFACVRRVAAAVALLLCGRWRARRETLRRDGDDEHAGGKQEARTRRETSTGQTRRRAARARTRGEAPETRPRATTRDDGCARPASIASHRTPIVTTRPRSRQTPRSDPSSQFLPLSHSLALARIISLFLCHIVPSSGLWVL